jgi:hypothetical protein
MDGKIFNSQGVHVATVRGSTIFSLRGEKLYDLRGINIYKLSGELVGHLASAGASEKYLLREADVGSQSADTIKLGFSSCLGRKQKTCQREPAHRPEDAQPPHGRTCVRAALRRNGQRKARHRAWSI